MSQRETIKVIGDILSNQMGLRNSGEDSQIMLTYERFNIPPNNDIYIALSYIDGKPIANNNYFDGTTLVETQQVTMLYHIQIDIMSFGPDARTRKEEIYMSLRSLYAEELMDDYGIQIARMPSAFADAASLEETKMLNRFTTTIAVTALLTKEVGNATNYDAFPFQTDDNGTKSPILNPEVPFNG